jgi:hypothetical protein
MNLTNEEVTFVNRSVQVYSRRFVFYRDQCPELEASFTDCTHYQWQNDQVDWTEALQAAAANTFMGNDAMFYPPTGN